MIEPISKIPQNETQRILDLLEQSEFTFHKTGSRFFGGVDTNSDWDFFVDDSATNFLRRIGFVNDRESLMFSYSDCDIVRVLVHKVTHIHVQVSRNIDKRRRIRNVLYRHSLKRFDKETRKRIWAIAQTIWDDAKSVRIRQCE